MHFGAYVISSQSHVDIIGTAYRAGARIVQYRDKKADTRELLETARKIREITRKYRSLFMVNDHLDIALLSEADGVHLGQDDLHVREARKIVPPGFIIGISTHSLEQAESARDAGADYIAIGPVFPTPTKETYPPVGLETVKQVVGAVSIPVVAIGGLNLRNIADLASMGVENVAMVREFQYNTGQVVKEINRRFGLKQSFAI